MSDTGANKQTVRDSIQRVWREGAIAALPEFWTQDCVNHAAPEPDNRGLYALRAYHEQSFAAFAAFSSMEIEIMQQIAEGDWVVTSIVARGTHIGPFFGIAPTGKTAALATIRMDRLENGKIAEHRSIADMAGLMRQLQN